MLILAPTYVCRCALQRLGGHFTPLCLEEGVSAVRVDVQLPELGRFDLVAKFWDESRTQECLDQVSNS